MFFRTSTVFARVTKVMPWILTKIQTGECGYIHALCEKNPYNSDCNLYRKKAGNNDYEQYQDFRTSNAEKTAAEITETIEVIKDSAKTKKCKKWKKKGKCSKKKIYKKCKKTCHKVIGVITETREKNKLH